jgi:hypothetical protein
MVSLSSIKLDTTAVASGVWKRLPYSADVEFLIASGRNPEFVSAMREAHRVRETDEAAYQRLYSEALARHIVKDWRGFDDAAGYSYAQALEFMTAPEFAHIREWVDSVAGSHAEYLVRTQAKAGKA